MSSNIECVARCRVERMVSDARQMQLKTTGVARFFEHERMRHGKRELRDRGDPVD